MRFRNASVRSKVTALIVSLALLWAFAAWVTLREGVNMLWAATINSSVVEPSEPLLVELQRERRLTVASLGNRLRPTGAALRQQRARTDAAHAAFASSIGGTAVRFGADDLLEERVAAVESRLSGLKAIRKAIDTGVTQPSQATAPYNAVIDDFYRMYDSVAAFDDKEIAKDGRTLAEMHHSREFLAREDAIMAGVFARDGFTEQEHADFVAATGVFRQTLSEAMSKLPDVDKPHYDAWAKSPAATRLRSMEERLIRHRVGADVLPVSGEDWRKTTEATLADLHTVTVTAGDRLLERITPVAVGVIVRLVLAGGLGLLAVIASIVLSITTTRQLLAQLKKLRDAAHELSDERLPGVVERIGRGEVVDVSREVPDLDFGDDEIGQVGQAFNTVQRTAIGVAAEQAELRRGIRDILLSLARRTQGLVHRQLTVLDVMERQETDPEDLKQLFRLDHLAIRMRRNAENLIVLSGSSPARTWRRSVPMVDVVRGALAEVEDYTRVTLMPMGEVVLVGRAVGDVIHLLAELIENAVSFSPPYTNVRVSGQLVANGYVIEIEDQGLGMKPEDLEAANERIADPPEFRISGTARLGLYVVSQLADRHDVKVVLKHSPYGGTTVVVLLPQELVEVDAGPDPADTDATPRLPRRSPTSATAASATATAARPATERPVAQRPVNEGNVRALKVAGPSRPPQQPEPDLPQPIEKGAATEPQPEAPSVFTPGGLPLRVPQANLAAALRDEGPPTTPDLEDDDDERSPEEIRAMMGSLQSGTRLGRTEAARLMEEQSGGDT